MSRYVAGCPSDGTREFTRVIRWKSPHFRFRPAPRSCVTTSPHGLALARGCSSNPNPDPCLTPTPINADP